MPWVTAFFLLLLAVLVGWIPVLGPLALGWAAARAEPGPRALLALLPALAVQLAGLLLGRTLAHAAQTATFSGWSLEGGLWWAVGWLFSPLSAALGRPFSHLLADTALGVFLLVFLAPVLPGLLLGALLGRGNRRR